MLNSKQRAILRSKASLIESIFQVGKDGVGEELINALSDALEKRELIKVTALKNTVDGKFDIADFLASKLNADVVTVIGNKIVFYRRSKRKDIIHLEI